MTRCFFLCFAIQVGFFPEADKMSESDVEQIRRGRKKLSALIVQGIPLATVIKVFKIDTIDYFSLAVQGREFEVLGTIPWDRIKIQVQVPTSSEV